MIFLLANCYCGDVRSNYTGLPGTNIIAYDQANSRYSKYAECMVGVYWAGAIPNDTIGMCAGEPLQLIPAFFLTKQKEIFVQSKIF